jgi:superfamily II DNA or RNA helicase
MSGLFESSVRQRGAAYFKSGYVRLLRGSVQEADALVRGSESYDVKLKWDYGELSLSCSCAYFEAGGPCKHLWAVILAAEKRGYLSAVRNIAKVVEIGAGEDDEDFFGSDDDDDDDEEDDDELPVVSSPPRSPAAIAQLRPQLPPAPKPPEWKARIASMAQDKTGQPRAEWPEKRQILYVVELSGSATAGNLVLAVCARELKANGEFGRALTTNLQRGQIPWLPLAEDREILSAIAGGSQYYGYGGYQDWDYGQVPASSVIRQPLAGTLIPMAVRTGRCYLRGAAGPDDLTPLTWDEGEPWRFELDLRVSRQPGHDGKERRVDKEPRGGKDVWSVAGVLRRGGATIEVSAPKLVTHGLVFVSGVVAPLAGDARFDWLLHLRRSGAIQSSSEDLDELLSTLLSTPGLPRLEVPEQLRFEEVTVLPRPCLRIRGNDRRHGNVKLAAELSFDYDGRQVAALLKSRGFYDSAARRFVCRDATAEQAASQLLHDSGVRFRQANWQHPEPGWELLPAKLPSVVRKLVHAGWHLDADGKVFRKPGEFRMGVSSGVDWFELEGGVQYGETSARLPQLLEALRRGESMVRLDDGTYGILPEEWLRRIGMLAGMGTPKDGHIRFRRSQAGLLDALLAMQPEATFDKGFERVRDELSRFRHVEAATQPEGFVGHLRDYQREGLGWMEFLRRFSFGGCLADDMGVGKTAQVLALLENRRELRSEAGTGKPSLVVVPRSLIFNWKQEAERFTPRLRVLDYTGLTRKATDFSGADLVLTTYGTLRRDAAFLKDEEFDYVVLDEAQAVKNAGTESSKAVRLLRCEHRLALSGTPVENHLGELWSLFEFLNPGMLGAAGVFKLTSGGAGRAVDEATSKLLSHALRPFILRRTKEQVARELPAKTEQTIYCELEPLQRKLYDELRQHYRDSLLSRIETQGLAKSKIMVLEALLRLRQAACHPGLIDAKRLDEPSAKLEALHEQLREVLGAGHKALVFSQFTSLLKIVRGRLDSEGVVYEYLDGKTRDRQAHVERFQNDADCKLFLISLKAGGLGLNLTAAEYVFLLDPWWNPAVEAQAVDRAHRIGQTKAVFAYRLIARDTVEEKVLELQKTKRDLASAIIGEDNALIRNLRREDLELLLS